ncbi:extracellular solute-binding protein [Flavitalea sp. BT771]|uniref:ABC transporter substrate-binding protein n=1 Tax=Flavitalea sp. BT771 TaxID=3063329 RepID=UPI0026E2331C|nr:extracellular solute-binding protein [Flavitalea sp. BT771]MDO6432204.1 extracellular solute-binding protein [Flavitalea sp. BT771]MDV6221114.1 extracellular solute-binding protein [Flavitalea sp. BT771]
MLKGISWDHPRGYQPLRAAADIWRKPSGIDLQWDVRTLQEFGDMPVEKLVDLYDLIIVDHPYMGEAASKGLLLPLDEYLPEEFLAVQAGESVGPSYESYRWNGHQYALPVDAAAQVAVYRMDLADAFGWQPPVSTDELRTAAAKLPGKYYMAVPLCPTDIWCVFLTLCAQYNNGEFFSPSGLDVEAGCYALDQLGEWSGFLHRDSFHMNPIQMMDRMVSEDEIVYCPFSFGYTNYARRDLSGRKLVFMDAPRRRADGVSTLLGGAGIAVSSRSTRQEASMDFIRYVLDPVVQRTVYYRNGGQPGHLSAWKDPVCNWDCGGFFSRTLYTLEHAYRRKGVPGFNRFQEQGADLVHRWVRDRAATSSCMRQLNNLYQTICYEAV